MEKLKSNEIHEAAEVLVDGLMDDPLWVYSFPNELQRKVAIYSIMAAEMQFKSLSSTWVYRSEGKIVNVALFAEHHWCCPCEVLSSMMYGITATLYYPIKKFARETFGSVNPLTFVAALLYSLVTLFHLRIIINICIFGSKSKSLFAEALVFLKGEGFEKDGLKRLIAIIPSTEDVEKGNDLVNGACDELKKEDAYEGYFVGVPDPNHLPFFKRHRFIEVGEGEVGGKTVKFMLRTEDHSALTAGDSVHIMKEKEEHNAIEE